MASPVGSRRAVSRTMAGIDGHVTSLRTKEERSTGGKSISSERICRFQRLTRGVAGKCDAVHRAGVAVVVVHGVVHRAAVVPQRERAGLPREAARELRANRVLEQ